MAQDFQRSLTAILCLWVASPLSHCCQRGRLDWSEWAQPRPSPRCSSGLTPRGLTQPLFSWQGADSASPGTPASKKGNSFQNLSINKDPDIHLVNARKQNNSMYKGHLCVICTKYGPWPPYSLAVGCPPKARLYRLPPVAVQPRSGPPVTVQAPLCSKPWIPRLRSRRKSGLRLLQGQGYMKKVGTPAPRAATVLPSGPYIRGVKTREPHFGPVFTFE